MTLCVDLLVWISRLCFGSPTGFGPEYKEESCVSIDFDFTILDKNGSKNGSIWKRRNATHKR